MYETGLIRSFQQAAQALLGIDQTTLAELAGVLLPTIQRMEASTGTVRGVVDARIKVVNALNRAGVQLIGEHARSDGGSRAVRWEQPGPPRCTTNRAIVGTARGPVSLISGSGFQISGICVTGLIARTATNIRAGARGPVAGMLHFGLRTAVHADRSTACELYPIVGGPWPCSSWSPGPWRRSTNLPP